MIRRHLAALIAVATLASPAAASEMLARSLGVPNGVYTLSELTALKTAIETDNRSKERAIRARAEKIAPLVVAGFSDKGFTPRSN